MSPHKDDFLNSPACLSDPAKTVLSFPSLCKMTPASFVIDSAIPRICACWKPVVSGMAMAQFRCSEPFEFLKNSINIDKFTGYFDKLLKIFQGKCGKLRGIAGPECARMRGIARVKIALPQELRKDTTLREA